MLQTVRTVQSYADAADNADALCISGPLFSGPAGPCFPTDVSTPVFKYACIPDGRIQGTQVSQCACDPRWQNSGYPGVPVCL